MLQTQFEIGCADRLARARSSSPEFLPCRFREENPPLGDGLFDRKLLLHPGFSDRDRQLMYSPNDADALRDANRPSRIQKIENMGTLQDLIIRRKQRKALLAWCIP